MIEPLTRLYAGFRLQQAFSSRTPLVHGNYCRSNNFIWSILTWCKMITNRKQFRHGKTLAPNIIYIINYTLRKWCEWTIRWASFLLACSHMHGCEWIWSWGDWISWHIRSIIMALWFSTVILFFSFFLNLQCNPNVFMKVFKHSCRRTFSYCSSLIRWFSLVFAFNQNQRIEN